MPTEEEILAAAKAQAGPNPNSTIATVRRASRQRGTRLAVVLGLVASSVVALTFASADPGRPAVTGSVFRDKNYNGIRDPHEPGVVDVEVRAYDSAGHFASAVTKLADRYAQQLTSEQDPTRNAVYSIDVSNIGAPPYRIEFNWTKYPFLQEGPSGKALNRYSETSSETSVAFIATNELGKRKINLGLANPIEYCQANPTLATTCFSLGGLRRTDDKICVVGNSACVDHDIDRPALHSFKWLDSGPLWSDAATGQVDPTYNAPVSRALARDVGSVWGLAHRSSDDAYLSAAFLKRHAALGPNGTGAIYITTGAGPTARTSLYADLNQLFPAVGGTAFAGNDPRRADPKFEDTLNYYFYDSKTFSAIGKLGLGDIELSNDGKLLYVVNLATRELVTLPGDLSSVKPGDPVAKYAIPAPCANPDDARPFSLTMHADTGHVIVGGTCTAESTKNRNDLSAYVLDFDPTTKAFAKFPLVTAPLSYFRGTDYCNVDTDHNLDWYPWNTSYGDPQAACGEYPRPWVSAVAVDNDSYIIGVMDRVGHQRGYYAGFPGYEEIDKERVANGASIQWEVMEPYGDVIVACPASGGGWQVESSGLCDDVDGPGNEFIDKHNPEFLVDDTRQWETFAGAFAQRSSDETLAMTAIDPVRFFSAGVHYTAYSTGLSSLSPGQGLPIKDRGYESYYSDISSDGTITNLFSKANGVGDLEIACDQAPVEVGNRVWRDANGNGIQDAGEPGIANVLVHLLKPGATPIAGGLFVPRGIVRDTVSTDSVGNYIFSSAPLPASDSDKSYAAGQTFKAGEAVEITIDASNFGAGKPLETLLLSPAAAGGDDRLDSDAVLSGSGTPTIAMAWPASPKNDHDEDFGFMPIDITPPTSTTTTTTTTTTGPTTTTSTTTTTTSSTTTTTTSSTTTTTAPPVSKGEISGFAWIDDDSNAGAEPNDVYDAGEENKIDDLGVDLLGLVNGEWQVLKSTTTAGGDYVFGQLDLDVPYRIRFRITDGYKSLVFVYPNVNNNTKDNIDSDAYPGSPERFADPDTADHLSRSGDTNTITLTSTSNKADNISAGIVHTVT